MPSPTDPSWADITPLSAPAEPNGSLASISYTPNYAESISYLRALMAANEFSRRAIELTSEVISMNPAHYTVWLYREKCLERVGEDLLKEREWLDGIAEANEKNYQIWGHRIWLVTKIAGDPSTPIEDLCTTLTHERTLMQSMLNRDSKNYHVWGYRQWFVEHFSLFSSPSELTFVESMISEDVRNNSAWNFRWFLLSNRTPTENQWDQEMKYTREKINLAPQNQAAWNYLRAVAAKMGSSVKELKGCVERYVEAGDVVSLFALELMAEVKLQEGDKAGAGEALDLLAKRYDPLRRRYWEFRKASMLN
ncbi:farnesyltransferase [Piedraia hortae CBS 480.64]|uniref:Protein farnesyltransferase/geranylgeranyltransferase type-1 subunit alpha n=1 Tax=Piedraia hortae CBS 480.64 TaxID=1314780 RepID=A0A6A7C7K2_9PEZI|nr:farnesyltransferase [Piedraia hortae CBS 480.64]